VLAVVTAVRLPETNARPLARLDAGSTLRGYGEVLATREFARHALPMALMFGALFAFFAGAPVLFIDHLDVSPSEFGLYPPISVSGFLIGTFAMRRLIGRKSMEFLCAVGLGILVLGAALMAAAPALGVVNKYIYVLSMLVMVTGFGFFLPLGMSAAIQPFRELSGTASAAMGFLQMTCGALATVIVSGFSDSLPALAFPLVMVGFNVAAALTYAALTPRRRARG
jgi:DHA1 family bicyclomycin/chloramphenicol resistance-like MFS transporter